MSKLSLRGWGGPSRLACAAALLGGFAWAAGCGDAATEPAPATPDPPRPTTVMVSPATAALTAIGATVQLTAEVRDQHGVAMASATVTWASGGAEVATVSSSGLVTAAGNGTATITATSGLATGSATVTVAEVANPDRAALVALYEATDGPNWVNNDKWLTDAPLGEWYGVDVDPSGRVIRLDLGGRWDIESRQRIRNGMAGPIPSDLVALTSLRRLDLSDNALTGSIPPELGALTDLTVLDLEHNRLAGEIPVALASLVKLERLALNDNALTGSIPPELGELTQLTYLHLGSNSLHPRNLLTGPIPPEIARLAKLAYLNLRYAELTGQIPAEIGELSQLGVLNLAGNRLEGTIPAELGKLDELVSLSLHQNRLIGAIPPELGNLKKLGALELFENSLTGTVPPELFNANELDWLRLDDNSLRGALPQRLPDHSTLRVLSFAGNIDLCAPGTARFTKWSQGLDDFKGGYCNEPDQQMLEALFESTSGESWSDSEGWLSGPALAEWDGVGTDSLGFVTVLDLSGKGLAGTLPQSIGNLARLVELRVGGNPTVSGPVPLSLALAGVPLTTLHYAETQLCTPADPSFQRWLGGVSSHEGTGTECAPVADRDRLAAFYEATNGPAWRNRRNWLTDVPLGEWHGVEVDGEGKVVVLRLSDNNLSGEVPPELGYLSSLESLDLQGNALSGAIPAQLGYLSNLESLFLANNALSGTIPAQLGYLPNLELLDLGGNRLDTAIPPELGNLANLEFLSFAGNDLSGPIPPQLGNLEKLTSLSLFACSGVTGTIPPELGNMSNLRVLSIGGGQLTGSIPPQLGKLADLRRLTLQGSRLTGRIPPELGNLANLEVLYLRDNKLSGPIPPELGNLSKLRDLRLFENDLEGSLPPELGGLRELERMDITENALSGPIPAELGQLANLEVLRLGINDLTGPIPPELGHLANLRELYVNGNRGMGGRLATGFGALSSLDTFQAGGTDICAPPELATWLEGIPSRRVPLCEAGFAGAYLTQTVQSPKFPVPLVAGEEALLRVFVTAARANQERLPPARASFHLDGALAHVADIPGQPGPGIPTEMDEGSLAQSLNALIPAHVIRPGLEMVIDVDPDGSLDPALGVAKRIPETGRAAVDVRVMPALDLTLIPLIWTHDPDSSVIATVAAMSEDPASHEMLSVARTLLPVEEIKVTAHEAVLTSAGSWSPFRVSYPLATWFGITEAIRVMEGGTGHYMSVLSRPRGGSAGGLARVGGRVSFSDLSPQTIAHELGHNMSLNHAPCGGASGPDRAYPHGDGATGDWGYDFADGGRLVPSHLYDLMSYCDPAWVGGYHFEKALRYRLADEKTSGAQAAEPVRSLLLWGGVDAEGQPHLDPAFVVDAPPSLPRRAGGAYRLSVEDADGRELLSLSFDMPQTADGDGASSFVFAFPVGPGWDSLASITLTGPGGSTTLDGETDLPMAILRDPRTGRVRGILHDPPPAAQMAADAAGVVAGPAWETIFSRGIPDAAAWRR